MPAALIQKVSQIAARPLRRWPVCDSRKCPKAGLIGSIAWPRKVPKGEAEKTQSGGARRPVGERDQKARRQAEAAG